jgi:hypothetical protein
VLTAEKCQETRIINTGDLPMLLGEDELQTVNVRVAIIYVYYFASESDKITHCVGQDDNSTVRPVIGKMIVPIKIVSSEGCRMHKRKACFLQTAAGEYME